VTCASRAGRSVALRSVPVYRAVELLKLLEQGVLALLERLLPALRLLHRGGYVGLARGEVAFVLWLFHVRQATGMAMHVVAREQLLPRPPDQVFPFFADAHNLEAITPPWLGFRVVTPQPIEMGPGTLIEYRLRLHRLPIRWRTTIAVWDPPRRFVDVQLEGPYRMWHHAHDFEAAPDGGTLMRDTVRYALPFGPLGALAHRAVVRRDLAAIFDYRRDAVLHKVK
jgi:ligand-binding SRPBCC domain-containing protein